MAVSSTPVLHCLATFAAFSLACAEFNLTILHTNDVHARYEQANLYGATCSPGEASGRKCVAGVARRFTKVEELRRISNNTILLDAGDQFQGTFWFFVHKGNITAHFMKLLRYDAMAVGNHEFDIGMDEFVQFVDNVTESFPVISSNIDTSKEPRLGKVKNFVIIDRGNQKIGVIGYTSTDTPFLVSPENIGQLKFKDEVQSIQQAAMELKAQGIQIIIAVGHSGFDIDLKIAAEVEEVDVVVGGHTNTFLYTGQPPSNDVPEGSYPAVVQKSSGSGIQALVVQDFYFGKYLGRLEVAFDDRGHVVGWSGNPILLDYRVLEDTEVLKDVAWFGVAVKEKGNEVVGRSSVFLNGTREECRARECNLGNAIVDAFLASGTSEGNVEEAKWARSALAVINGGGIRVSISKGPVLYQDILSVLPFQNTVDLVILRGQDVLAMFEQSVADYSLATLPGSFLQVSGFKVVYHMYEKPGSRVASVLVRCLSCDVPSYEPLVLGRNYSVLMPAFMVAGGDKYAMIRDNRLSHQILGQVDSDLFIDYVKATSPLTNGLEQRLQLIFNPPAAPQATCAASAPAKMTSVHVLPFLLFGFFGLKHANS